MASWHADFLIGEWRVSPKLSNIYKDGQTVSVKRKPMAVLVCLADADGEVVSRDDIMDQVWPGMAVTDDVLTQSIVELRKVFDDDAKQPRIIETIPRVGFRLIKAVAPVGMESSRDAPTTTRRYALAAIALLAAGVGVWTVLERQESTRTSSQGQPSIVVLPFVNMSDDPGNEYFSDGLSEEIRTQLARVPGLKVVGRTSSSAFKDKNEDLRLIGQTLGVKNVLEGSVRKSSDLVRITAQLVNVLDGASIWSETYDRTMTDIFTVQDDVAAAVIDALQLYVDTNPTRGRPTESPEAYVMFLKARSALNDFDNRDARALLLEATEIDPNFAEAHELLAYTYWDAPGEIGPVEAQRLSKEAATRAIAIDPDLVFAEILYQLSDMNPVSRLVVIEALEHGLHEQPDNLWLLEGLVYMLTECGYIREALRLAERYVELDPLSRIAKSHWSATLYAAGRTTEAVAALEFVNQRDVNPDSWTWTLNGVNLVEKRDESAIAHFESYLHHSDPTWLMELVNRARDPVTGQAYLDRRIPQIAVSVAEVGKFNWEEELISLYLFFGFLDRYFELLLATEPTDATWHYSSLHVWRGTVFRRLGFTAHPKYLEVVKLLSIDDVWEHRGPPDFCETLDSQWVCE